MLPIHENMLMALVQMVVMFEELVKEVRTNRGLYVSVIKQLVPADIERYLLVRRDASDPQVKDAAHAAMGWTLANKRGAQRSGTASGRGGPGRKRKSQTAAKKVDPSQLRGREAQRWWAKFKEKQKVAITGLKSSLSSIWRVAGINHKWSWTNDEHSQGTGNPTLSDELKLLSQKTKRQDADAGKVKKQAARIEQEDLVRFQQQVYTPDVKVYTPLRGCIHLM